MQNDDQLQSQYQEILNKYASSLTPPAETAPVPESVPEPEISSPEVSSMTSPEPDPLIVPTPVIEQPPEKIVPPIYFPPEEKTESSSNFFKYLFYFSLLVFIAVASAVFYNFSQSQQDNTPTSEAPTPTVMASQFCEVGTNKYPVGQSFPSPDACNTCSCSPDLTVVCTQKACVSPAEVPSVKKTVGKVYKDIKYGYQFECPTTAKYVLEATSVNGNKIPFKQESCTQGESTTTISVYDNTLVHDFGNLNTQVSPNKKYVVTLEGDDDIISTFKFL